MKKKAASRNKLYSAFLPLAITLLGLSSLNAQLLPVEKVRSDFRKLLQRPPEAPNATTQTFTNDSLIIEKGFFYSELTEKVPLLIYRPLSIAIKKMPVVICLHGTGGNKEGMNDIMNRLTKAGFIAVAIDGRFHGERSNNSGGENKYVEAIVAAFRNGDSLHQRYPFFYDTVYDVWKLVDYLITRPDIDTARIGMMGVSKGGIETWMAASVDTRIKVAVPVIATQSFAWSLNNNRWQGRAKTIWGAHEAAAKDLGDSGVNAKNVKALWDKLLPGITSEFDCPSMVRLFAPRPLLLLNTEKDQNCPLPGAQLAFDAATDAYRSKSALDKLGINVELNEPHRFTAKHLDMAIGWFKKWL